jgi:aminopeptidase
VSDLDRAVHAVVRDCLGVKEGEEVLVVCNPATQHLGERLREEAADVGADAVLTLISERASHAAEPPRTVAEAMSEARQRERRSLRHDAGGYRGHGRPRDERRHGRAAA